VNWQDIEDLSFKEGILGSQVTFTKHDGETLTMAYVPKDQVRKLYRAGMAAIQSPSNTDGTEAPILPDAADPADELTAKLKKLKTLFERELITEAEYENKKNELLSQL